ncbi:autoinducer binding domain-containing protein [Celeribacter sp.]|uniref:autoinducer binding domain-containing protein n=1 Tax=Celeribacter sp. TaxID=1890673 RepID=UPI003A932F5A
MSSPAEMTRLLSKLGGLSPSGYSTALHIRYASPLFMDLSYPSDWIEHYTINAFALRDPMIAWGLSCEGTTRWSETGLPDPFNIMGQAADYGLKYGVSVSCGEVRSRSIVASARADREFTDAEMKEIAKIARILHQVSEPRQQLTPAQVQALRCIASGDRYAAAASKLGISESALKARLVSARERLMARTTSEAIQKAKDIRLL